MNRFFDESRWQQSITRPDWYLELNDELQVFREKWEKDPDSEQTKHHKEAVRGFLNKQLI